MALSLKAAGIKLLTFLSRPPSPVPRTALLFRSSLRNSLLRLTLPTLIGTALGPLLILALCSPFLGFPRSLEGHFSSAESTFPAYLRQSLTSPLGLGSVSFTTPVVKPRSSRVAPLTPHNRATCNERLPRHNTPDHSSTFHGSAGRTR